MQLSCSFCSNCLDRDGCNATVSALLWERIFFDPHRPYQPPPDWSRLRNKREVIAGLRRRGEGVPSQKHPFVGKHKAGGSRIFFSVTYQFGRVGVSGQVREIL